MAPTSLPDILPFLGVWLTVPEIASLRAVSREMRLAAQMACLVRLRWSLSPWLSKQHSFALFMQTLLRCNAIITGNFVLRFLLDDGSEEFPTGSMDIVCGGQSESVKEIMEDFLGSIGGAVWRTKTREAVGPSMGGVIEEKIFMMWDGNIVTEYTIRLLYTSSEHPTSILPYCWATHLACAITPSAVVVPYPKTTFNRLGLVPPQRSLTLPPAKVIISNAREGFFVRSMPITPRPGTAELPWAYCATTPRSLLDSATFRFSWDHKQSTVLVRGVEGVVHGFSGGYGVGWQYGGYELGGLSRVALLNYSYADAMPIRGSSPAYDSIGIYGVLS